MSKSFLRGISAAFDLFPQEREVIVLLPRYSNEEAFKNDLEQVGADMRFAIKSIEQAKDFPKQDNDGLKTIGPSA